MALQLCAPLVATCAVLYTYVLLSLSPTLSTIVGGVHSAFRRRLAGFATSQGTANPWEIGDPEVYFVQLAACPTVTVTDFCAVPPAPWQVSTYVVD
jgi:hypothetical protein